MGYYSSTPMKTNTSWKFCFFLVQLFLSISGVISFVVTKSSPNNIQQRAHEARYGTYPKSFVLDSSSFHSSVKFSISKPFFLYKENNEMDLGADFGRNGNNEDDTKPKSKKFNDGRGDDIIMYNGNVNGGNGNDNGDDNNGNGDGNENNNNGDGNDDDNSTSDKDVSAALTLAVLLKKYGQSIDSFPPPLQTIAKSLQDSASKSITSLEEIQLNVIKSYFNLLYINPKTLNSVNTATKIPLSFMGKFFWKPILAIEGLRDRILMDTGFSTKLGIEVTIGLTMQGLAEYERRRENIWKEFDFVIANCLTGLIANFAALYLSAPTLANAMISSNPASPVSSGGILRSLVDIKKMLPDNAFQTVAPGQTAFTLSQRFLTMVFAAPNLFAVGGAATACGYGLTTVLASLRGKDENEQVEKNENRSEVSLLKTSVVIGTYLAISSNIRYQLVAGVIEQRMLDPFCNRLPVLTNQMINPATAEMVKATGSFVARTGNTFLGAAFLIDFLKFFGCNG